MKQFTGKTKTDLVRDFNQINKKRVRIISTRAGEESLNNLIAENKNAIIIELFTHKNGMGIGHVSGFIVEVDRQ